MLHSFTSFLANWDLLSFNGWIRNKSIGIIITFLFNRTLKPLVYLLSSISTACSRWYRLSYSSGPVCLLSNVLSYNGILYCMLTVKYSLLIEWANNNARRRTETIRDDVCCSHEIKVARRLTISQWTHTPVHHSILWFQFCLFIIFWYW